MPTDHTNHHLTQSLWKIYHRLPRPSAWQNSGNLPWNQPDFSERMLREHLDESHGAASRTQRERTHQIEWLWSKLGLSAGAHLFDVTCGPGLYAVPFAQQGCIVTGVDFSPASLAYAQDLARSEGVYSRCHFIEQDVQDFEMGTTKFEAAIFIYGQLAVFPKETAQNLLNRIALALKPGGTLCLELLDQDRVDKKNSTWWFTDNSGLWGDTPFLHLGERFWDPTTKISTERFHIIDLESGDLREIILSDQTYSQQTMQQMLETAGFSQIEIYPAWAGLPLYDIEEWVVYLARK